MVMDMTIRDIIIIMVMDVDVKRVRKNVRNANHLKKRKRKFIFQILNLEGSDLMIKDL